MVSTAIIALLMLILVTMTEATRKTWISTTSRAEEFRGARTAFESMTRRLSQSTLNTYWDYFDASGISRTPDNSNSFIPARYARQSELRFISGQASALGLPSSSCPTHAVFFQAPLGFVSDTTTYSRMENLLNTWGYFVQFGDDSLLRPAFVTKQLAPYRYRFRLTELMEPSESLSLYKEELSVGGNSFYTTRSWYQIPFATSPRPARVLAENIVALVLLPKLTPYDQKAGNYSDGSLAPSYLYDSTTTTSDRNLNPKNQLPPVIQVTMIAVDETSFTRLQKAATSMPALGLSSLFVTVGDTVDPTKTGLAKDLQTLQTTLQTNKLTYRVFSTNVSLKAAKWSREQVN
ncbi:MAG: Verru_Chthon cassette protein C [Chthoniobacter sp.]|nr:Verru_Chthon cassette protein C [Chthoniobacter sp.]